MDLELFFLIGMKVTFSNTSSFKLYLGNGATYYLLYLGMWPSQIL
jgi:hypothetical protein